MKPIHKFNNGQGATLCHQCNCIISLGYTDDLYCKECIKERRKEAAEKLFPDYQQGSFISTQDRQREGFIAGAKWQQEQDKNKYSEEEVLEILNKRVFDLKHKKDIKTNKEWFEQFKNK